MAEAAVAIVINKAIAAKALLEGEGHHLQGDISWIENQMKTFQSYLKDAESKKATGFINSIRDLALDLEDILDIYLPEIESHESKGSFGFLKHSSCMSCSDVAENDLSQRIQELQKRAAEIEQSKGGIAAEPNVDRTFEKKTNKTKKKNFHRKEAEKIMAKITGGDKKCRIISIVGAGGVGKTTAAKEIYHQVRSAFDCHAKVYISEKSTVGDILNDIAKQVHLGEREMKQNLQENLHLFLRKKKYVIFLDDFSDKWDILRDTVMTTSRKGSRIIVTCRKEEFQKLASHLDGLDKKKILDDSVALNPLSVREGMKLFYASMEENLSQDLKTIGDEIVQKCRGSALAIHVAAGLLKARRNERSWNEVLQRMKEDVGNERMILDLSYQDLPAKLKPFFLYLGIFPRNSEIYVSELVSLWIAEKLVFEVDESRKPDKIAEDYIDELIERNLIQVSRRRFDDRVKSCSIQNGLHDLCTRKAEEINFFFNWNPDLASTARRVTSNSSSTKFTVPKKLRALLYFSKGRELADFIHRNASDLRFLQLLSIQIESKAIDIPVEIANLSGLIYLKLKGQFMSVPSCIRKLKRLETLEVRTREVPESILKIKHLKHLFVSGAIMVKSKIKERRGTLEIDSQNLETLDFDYQYGYHLSPSSFKKLPSLKTLKTVVASTLTLDAFCGPTQSSEKLEYLKLRFGSTSEIPQKMNLSGYKYLRTLYLFFDRSSMSCSFEFPKTLVKITLGGIVTEDKDPLENLRRLPSLRIIKVKNCTARKIDFSGYGNFPQLETLMLCDTKFQLLEVDVKGMPNITKFIYRGPPIELPKKLKDIMVNIDIDRRDDNGSWLGRLKRPIQIIRDRFEVLKQALGPAEGQIA